MLLERVVLESVAKKNKRISEIVKDLEISAEIVSNVLSKLTMKGLLTFTADGYEISSNDLAWFNINKIDSVKEELKEITDNVVETCLENKEKNLYKLQKIMLSEKEEKILNSLLNSVESYINNLREDHRKHNKKEKTSNQKIVFWGHSSYSAVVGKAIERAC